MWHWQPHCGIGAHCARAFLRAFYFACALRFTAFGGEKGKRRKTETGIKRPPLGGRQCAYGMRAFHALLPPHRAAPLSSLPAARAATAHAGTSLRAHIKQCLGSGSQWHGLASLIQWYAWGGQDGHVKRQKDSHLPVWHGRKRKQEPPSSHAYSQHATIPQASSPHYISMGKTCLSPLPPFSHLWGCCFGAEKKRQELFANLGKSIFIFPNHGGSLPMLFVAFFLSRRSLPWQLPQALSLKEAQRREEAWQAHGGSWYIVSACSLGRRQGRREKSCCLLS